MSVQLGRLFVVGVQDPLPMVGFPQGKMRLKMRQNRLAVAYVRLPSGTRAYAVQVEGDRWVPGPCLGLNRRDV